jgi:hypothetical protein
MPSPRNGRPQDRRRAPQSAPAAPPADDYALIVGGMVSCRKCAALLLDTRPAREQHSTFHTALRRLWDQAEVRP